MQRALAKQAEAERERRAKVINAQGEFEAAQKTCDAADLIGAHPPALQLRFFQTLLDLSSCPLYPSDATDELLSVDVGCLRIFRKITKKLN